MVYLYVPWLARPRKDLRGFLDIFVIDRREYNRNRHSY